MSTEAPFNKAIAVILAGGQSRRMGQDKALLRLNGIPLVQYVQRSLAIIFDETLVVGRSEGGLLIPGLNCLPDIEKGLGPLGGLLTALRYAKGRPLFLVGCDMPFLNPDAVRLVMERAHGWDAALPVVGGQIQPLHAVYNGTCLSMAERQVQNRVLSMHRLIGELQVDLIGEDELRLVDPDLRSVQGLNSPEEYEKAAQQVRTLP